ncbi:MAG: hypothetical protein IMZ66_12385 [Planctomycetes bacterium]|nr:hypothetical protein [Planctomycetota bacterium]
MRKLWLLGLLGALVLVVGPMIVAAAEEGTRVGPPREGRAAEAKAERKEAPPALTDAQKEALKAEVAALEEAIAKLRLKAIDVLGEQQGRVFTMGTVMKAVRAGMPEGKREGKPEGAAAERRRAPEGKKAGEDAPK